MTPQPGALALLATLLAAVALVPAVSGAVVVVGPSEITSVGYECTINPVKCNVTLPTTDAYFNGFYETGSNHQAACWTAGQPTGAFTVDVSNTAATSPLEGSYQVTAKSPCGAGLFVGGALTAALKGAKLRDLAEVKYTVMRIAGDATLQMALQFDFDTNVEDASTTWQGRLVHLLPGSWADSAWEDIDAKTQGTWFRTAVTGAAPADWPAGLVRKACSLAQPCSWEEVQYSWPEGGLRNDAVAGTNIGVKAGSNWGVDFVGHVDKFIVNSTTFTFKSAKCGNGKYDAQAEECDGGALCNTDCACPTKYESDGAGGCSPKCGNKAVDEDEDCDGGASCNTDCTCPVKYESDGSAGCSPKCGNGILDDDEQCDGGVDCRDNCTCPPANGAPREADGKSPPGCQKKCGNGVIDFGEVCDKTDPNCQGNCSACKNKYRPNAAGLCVRV